MQISSLSLSELKSSTPETIFQILSEQGAIAIKKPSNNFEKLREITLDCMHQYMQLPTVNKKQYEYVDGEHSWATGATVRKFTIGQNEFLKGTFIANPECDDITEGLSHDQSQQIRNQYWQMALPNIWPEQDIPQMKAAFQTTCQAIIEAGKLISEKLDQYFAEHHPTIVSEKLSQYIDSKCHRGKLVSYEPHQSQSTETSQQWTLAHHDPTIFTALTHPRYIDQSGSYHDAITASNVYFTKGDTQVAINWSQDAALFLLGEQAQILTNGLLEATGHIVKSSPETHNLRRVQLVLSLLSHWNTAIPQQLSDHALELTKLPESTEWQEQLGKGATIKGASQDTHNIGYKVIKMPLGNKVKQAANFGEFIHVASHRGTVLCGASVY